MSAVTVEKAVTKNAATQLDASATQRSGITASKFFAVVVQLSLLGFVIWQFRIESPVFFRLAVLAFAGFTVHALLPLRFRLPFFLGLSLVGIGVVLGITNAIWLVAIGLGLIGLCHLPLSFRIRIAVLVAAGVLLAAMRAKWLPTLWSDAIWPILGSIFMFRLIVYFYELQHEKKPASITETLSYFFLLPNVCFPLFPVVDYKTFRRNYFDDDSYRIYQVGVDWMTRGVIHLILYRLVYLHLTLAPSDVNNTGDLLRYIVTTYLLYLRISGQFHLIVGMLYLFGFRLPETHHLYLLASSFTDFWRRINIYWKDFMMKLVYYPSFFRLRRLGGNKALVGATVIVFFVTWILHSYQWFWLRGGFPVELQDVLFWGILGALVIFGSLREMNRPRQSSAARKPARAPMVALRTVATFSAICILWSLWSAESVMSWLTLWMVPWGISLRSVLLFIALIGMMWLLALSGRWLMEEKREGGIVGRPAAYSTALLVGLLLVGNTGFYSQFFPSVSKTVASLQGSTLNAGDAALQHKGYYEKLDSASRMSAQLWSVEAQRPAHWVALNETEAYRKRDDFLLGDLKPGAHITFEDQPLTVNQWGMRDRDRAVEKSTDTYRIALLGPSHVMGSGVADGQTIADFLEKELNNSRTAPNRHYEVLNFGVAGFSLLQQLRMLEDRAFRFKPDAVFITDQSLLKPAIVGHMLAVVHDRRSNPYPELQALIRHAGVDEFANDGIAVPFSNVRTVLGKAGIRTRMPWSEADRKLRLAADSIVDWTLRDIVRRCEEHGAVPVFIALDTVGDPPSSEPLSLHQAADAGFLVFNLFDVWQGQDRASLRVGAWDNHPNAAGNRLIAERLKNLIEQHRSYLRLDQPTFQTSLQPSSSASSN